MSVAQRIKETISAVCPIVGVAWSEEAQVITRIDYAPEATVGERAAADSAAAAFDWSAEAQTVWLNLNERTTAKTLVASGIMPHEKVARAVVSVLLDEINILRQWLAAFKVEAAASVSLADLRTRIATLPATADRTLAQAKTAIANKIDGGTVD